METQKDLLMYFQTSLRNMGLYTSLSFGALGYSRFYRGKNPTYNIYFVIVSLVFTSLTIYIGISLLKDLTSFNKKIKSSYIDKWEIIPKIILFFNIGGLVFGLFTLYNEIITKTAVKHDDISNAIKAVIL
tara:strand:- start:1725 stop:2114 length:390 start_codon:yes stop_codon:yes gene_type:complete